MKVLIDGKEVEFENSVKVIHEDQFIGMNDRNQECYGQLHITLNSEGMIADLIEDGSDEVDRSMWQDLEDLTTACH